MILIKQLTILTLASTAAFMASAPYSLANTKTSAVYSNYQPNYVVGRHTPATSGTYLDGSITATQFYKAGINRYKKGKIEKAVESFKAVLRANGLDKQAYFYLAKIKQQQGDTELANKYIKAYHSIR